MKQTIRISIAVAIIATTQTAAIAAIQPDEMADALDEYRLAVLEAAELEQQRLLAELHRLNGPYDNGDFPSAVERWRPAVATYFPTEQVDWALRIIECESHGDPNAKNPRSTASGLFQHLASLWEERAAAAGWPGADVFDPYANIAVAAWLFETGGPGHWVCKANT
jgi:hypothetical protein